MDRVLTGLASLAFLLGVSGRARADLMVYHSEADFLSHTAPGYFLNTFPNAGGPLPSAQTFSRNGFAYTAAARLDFFSKPNEFSTNAAATPIVFTFAGDGVTAVGGDFWLTDAPFNTAPGTLTVGLSGGRTFDLVNPGPATFLGFTSDTPIASLTLTPPPRSSTFATAGNFIAGRVAVDHGPEPASLVTASLGLAVGAAFLWRRRRRAARATAP